MRALDRPEPGSAAGAAAPRTPASDTAARWRHLAAWDAPAMGGRLAIDVTVPVRADPRDALADQRAAGRLAARAAARLGRWSARLTRFDAASDLARLNADPRTDVPVRPTLAAVMRWAQEAAALTGGIVDVTLLSERLAAESMPPAAPPAAGGTTAAPAGARTWHLGGGRRRERVRRTPGVTFDLDGVAKGWLADRTLGLLDAAAGAIVDADGDVAIRLAPGDAADIGIADPRVPGALLGTLHIGASGASGTSGARFGVATSGTTIHRWASSGATTHHLIDPRTRRPASTDVVQATVLAGSAREAEALAKTAVIQGLSAGVRFLDASGALAAVLLTTDGRCVALPRSVAWLGND